MDDGAVDAGVGVTAPHGVPPSKERARRLVMTITGFWAIYALAAQAPGSVRFIVMPAGLACGFVFFYTVSQVAAEGTGYGPLDFWNGIPGHSRAPAKDRRRVGFEILRPTWWRTVVAATGWPRALVWLVLVLALAAALTSVFLTFASLGG